MTSNPSNSQYVLPFDQAKNDLLSQIRFLRGVDLGEFLIVERTGRFADGLSPGRTEGVIQLLERLALLGNDLTERGGAVFVKAQIIAIAARVEARRTVADRTVRNWRVDAESLGILATDHRSHKWGRCEWNLFRIDVARIREIVAAAASPNEGGNGRKWAETVAAPRAEIIAAPRAETVAAPRHCIPIEDKPTANCGGVSLERTQEGKVVEPRNTQEHVIRECVRLKVYAAAEVLTKAAERVGWDYLGELVEFYKSRPGAWGVGALRNRIRHSWPGIAIDEQWPTPAVNDVPKNETRELSADRSKELLRYAIIRKGRAAGAPETEIARRLQAAGVESL